LFVVRHVAAHPLKDRWLDGIASTDGEIQLGVAWQQSLRTGRGS
jgi:hypothetical protein